jgi:hypothetical protein
VIDDLDAEAIVTSGTMGHAGPGSVSKIKVPGATISPRWNRVLTSERWL